MTSKNKYERYRESPYWRPLERAIKELILNDDLEEKTTRSNIVGYLCMKLSKAKRLTKKKKKR